MEVSVQGEGDINSNRGRQRNHKRVEFLGTPLRVNDSLRRKYYDSAMVGDVEYQIGDCVMVRPDIKGSASYIGRIVYLLEEKHEKIAHVQYFCRGSDTVLGELSDKKELFALDDCEDVQLFELMRKVQISHEPLGPKLVWFRPLLAYYSSVFDYKDAFQPTKSTKLVFRAYCSCRT